MTALIRATPMNFCHIFCPQRGEGGLERENWSASVALRFLLKFKKNDDHSEFLNFFLFYFSSFFLFSFLYPVWRSKKSYGLRLLL